MTGRHHGGPTTGAIERSARRIEVREMAMRRTLPAIAFLAGAALAASAFFVGSELSTPTAPQLSTSTPSLADESRELVARIEDLEARLDALSRTAPPAAVRSDETRAPDRSEPAQPVTAGAGPAAATPFGPGADRAAGMEQLRRLRDAPDDATRLEIARTLLKDENPMAAMSALRVLADLAPKEALATVDSWVAAGQKGDMNPWQVERAIATLVGGQGAAALGTDLDSKLRDWYSRGEEELKRTTARSLESRGDSGPMQQLVAGYRSDLGNADVGRRTRAIESLGRTRSREAVPALVPMLADPSDEVRLGALDALRRTGSETVIDQIRPLLDDPVAAVRDRATRTIESLRRGEREPDFRGDFRGGEFRGDFRGGDFRGGDFRGGFPFDGGRRGSN
jgi:HEAT repeat protein